MKMASIDTLREKIESLRKRFVVIYAYYFTSKYTCKYCRFKGFYKKNGIGCFGGSGEDALSRIKCPIELQMPKWNRYSQSVNVSNGCNRFLNNLRTIWINLFRSSI